jgi:hypothetical protein
MYWYFKATLDTRVEGEDSDTFFSLLWSEIYNLNMVGARANLRPHLR